VVRRRATLAAAVFALLLGAIPQAPARDTADARVTFAFWNLRNYRLEPSVGTSPGASTPAKDAKSIEATVGALARIRPDILGVCEMGSPRDLADLQARLGKAGVDLPHATIVEGADGERHVALLSRFPIKSIAHDTRSAFTVGGLRHAVRRGFLDCVVEAGPAFPLRLLGAHLKSRRPEPGLDQAEFRRQESLLLRQRIESILRADPTTPLLVYGDFNDLKNSPVVRGLVGHPRNPDTLTMLPLEDKVGDHWTYHWEEADEYHRVDYVLVSAALRPLVDRRRSFVFRDKGWRTASDHRPLVVTLNLPDAMP
jgi:endonuclease/exonuclease/phosphatase family metal-dependent hydrolase